MYNVKDTLKLIKSYYNISVVEQRDQENIKKHKK